MKASQPHEQVQLSIQLGKTYRRLPAPASGTNPNLALAIDKLNAAYTANPASTELAIELGGAFLEGKQDAKATALTEKLLAGDKLAKAPPEIRARYSVPLASSAAMAALRARCPATACARCASSGWLMAWAVACT